MFQNSSCFVLLTLIALALFAQVQVTKCEAAAPIIISKLTPAIPSISEDNNNNDSSTSANTPPNYNEEFSVSYNETVLIVKKSFVGTISLLCNATYPVTWTMDTVENQWVMSSGADRQVSNFTDPSTYKYSINLNLMRGDDEDYLEKYECHGVSNPESKSSLTIVSEKKDEPYCELKLDVQTSAAYLEIYWNSTNESEILIPCSTLNLNESHVELFKVTNGTTSGGPLGQSDGVRYEEFTGFYLRPPQAAGETEYLCALICHEAGKPDRPCRQPKQTTTITEDDYDEYTLKPDPAEGSSELIEMQDVVVVFTVKNANLSNQTRQVEMTEKTEKLWIGRIQYYDFAATCCFLSPVHRYGLWRRTAFVETECDAPLLCLTNKRVRQSMTSIRSHYAYERNETCGEMYYSAYSGWTPSALRCIDKTNGLVSKEGMLNGNPQASMSIVSDSPLTWPNCYVGQTLTLTCKVNQFFFARGLFWELEWNNSTIETIRGIEESSNSIRLDLLLNGTDLTNVECKAPLWNSTEWVSKGLTYGRLNVLVPSAPHSPSTGLDAIFENITLYTGQDVILECDFQGIPEPEFTWRVVSLDSSSHLYSYELTRQQNGYAGPTRSMTLEKLSRSRDNGNGTGVYVCHVSNFVGNATKIFTVQAKDYIPPKLAGWTKETVVLYSDEQNKRIACSILEGDPIPTLSWMRFDHNASEIPGVEIETKDQDSYLIFTKVRPELEGDYFCYATTFRETVNKTFVLRVRDSPQSRVWLEISVILLSLILTIVFVSWFYLYKKNARKISHLQMMVEFNNTLAPARSVTTMTPLVD